MDAANLVMGTALIWEAEFSPGAGNHCRVYWGSHGCRHDRGHDPELPHECDCCECGDAHPDTGHGSLCVAKPPYYGPGTTFYGEEAEALGLPVRPLDPPELPSP